MNGLIFTYALTFGGTIASIFRPYYGLLIYVCFAIIKPPVIWPWSVPAGPYSRIIGIAFLLGWAINGFGDGRLGRAKPVVWALLGYFLWVVLSTIFGMHPAKGVPFIEYMAKIILPFVAAITLVHTWDQLRVLLWVIVGSSAFLAYEANLLYLDGYDVEHNPLLGLDNNSFSILMTLSFGLSFVWAFEDSVMWRRGMLFGFAAAMAHVPMMSMSRGGMLGMLAAAIVAVALVPKTRKTWWMIGAGILAASAMAGPSVINEFSSSFKPQGERDATSENRVLLWKDCTDTMLKNPLFGIGQECWGDAAATYGWRRGVEAHSLWFQTAAELGVPGVTFLLCFYFLTVFNSWRASRRTDAIWMPTIARMMASAIVGFAISASFVTVEGFEMPFYVAMIGACATKIAFQEQAVGVMESDYDAEDAEDLGASHGWAGAH